MSGDESDDHRGSRPDDPVTQFRQVRDECLVAIACLTTIAIRTRIKCAHAALVCVA